MLYSKINNGFYSVEIHGEAVPSDCVEITDEQYKNLLEAQAGGKKITSDDSGYPIAVDRTDNRTYAEKRAAEYPPSADYLDGVVKGDQAQIDAYIAACMAVKAKYPKPEGQ